MAKKQKNSNNMIFDFGDDNDSWLEPYRLHNAEIDLKLKYKEDKHESTHFQKLLRRLLAEDKKGLVKSAENMNFVSWRRLVDIIKDPDKITWEELFEITKYFYKRQLIKDVGEIYYSFRNAHIGYDWFEDYNAYLRSRQWAFLKKLTFYRDFNKCVRCGNQATEVHHYSYPKRWFDDRLENLVSLCRECHRSKHLDRGLNTSEIFVAIRPMINIDDLLK